MTQTISISLGGLLFHIDDEAYDILKSYLQAIESQFSNDMEKKEIIQDIEARLAELFCERINRQQDLVLVNHVNEAIEIMGEPQDYGDGDDGSKESGHDFRKVKPSKRMYRNPDDRILGGVSSGLGAYFDIPVWVFRVAFIVFGVFFLTGIIIYLILWIAIPEAVTSAQKLEMRGKPITVENIKNTVKSEFEKVKKNMDL